MYGLLSCSLKKGVVAGLLLLGATFSSGFMPRVEPRPSEESMRLARGEESEARSDDRKENSAGESDLSASSQPRRGRQCRIPKRQLSWYKPRW